MVISPLRAMKICKLLYFMIKDGGRITYLLNNLNICGPGRRCRYITAALNLILDELTQIGALCFV